jgi:hypothetical protein
VSALDEGSSRLRDFPTMSPVDPVEPGPPERAASKRPMIEVGAEFRFRSRGQVVGGFIVAVVLLLVLLGGLGAWLGSEPGTLAIVVLVFAGYCTLAYFVRPKPNHDEVGILGGMNSMNRLLLQLAVLFALGAYFSGNLVDGVRYLLKKELPQDRLMERI